MMMCTTAVLSTTTASHLVEGARGDEEDNKGIRYLLHHNLKVFARAIISLSKLGEDLLLEPSAEGLSVKSFNKTKSAYGVYLFSPEFFSECDLSLIRPDDPAMIFRISMKCALNMLKGVQTGEKNLISCEIWIDPSSDYFKANMLFAFDCTRTYSINFLECASSYRTMADKSKLMNLAITSSDTLMCVLNQMRSDSETLIIVAGEDSFALKNYSENEDDRRRMVKTESNIALERFSKHRIRRPSEISFSFKEFRAIVHFAELNGAQVNMYFDIAGRPLIVALESDATFTAEFIIATIESDEHEEEQQETTPMQSQSRTRSTRTSRQHSAPHPEQDQNEHEGRNERVEENMEVDLDHNGSRNRDAEPEEPPQWRSRCEEGPPAKSQRLGESVERRERPTEQDVGIAEDVEMQDNFVLQENHEEQIVQDEPLPATPPPSFYQPVVAEDPSEAEALRSLKKEEDDFSEQRIDKDEVISVLEKPSLLSKPEVPKRKQLNTQARNFRRHFLGLDAGGTQRDSQQLRGAAALADDSEHEEEEGE